MTLSGGSRGNPLPDNGVADSYSSRHVDKSLLGSASVGESVGEESPSDVGYIDAHPPISRPVGSIRDLSVRSRSVGHPPGSTEIKT